jgi:predicted transcriptional regulator
MNERIAEIRQAIEEAKNQGMGRGKRLFRPELREAVVAVASERRKAGAGWKKIAAELGLATKTVERWCGGTPSRAGRMRRVKIVSEPSKASDIGCTVVGPAGIRVEGLRLSDVVELWRRLM